MKLVFVSNYINHHQIPLSNELYRILKDDYKFIQTMPMDKERIALGWKADTSCPYVIHAYKSDKERQFAQMLIDEADAVIFGAISSHPWLDNRAERNKLTFIYSERIYKQGQWKALSPANRETVRREYLGYQNKKFYILAASAYLGADLNLFKGYKNKIYKWGYFTEFHDKIPLKNNSKITLLWVGRLIDWKHPMMFIDLIQQLAEKGYDFEAKLIGTGPLQEKIIKNAKYQQVKNYITMLGAMPPERVRSYMEQSDIFVATSDYQEGWGAVINEAMNSKCAVVCSHAMGAVPYLVNNRRNGMIFRSLNRNELFECVEEIMNDPNFMRALQQQAYQTIANVWSPLNAANRIVKLSTALLNNEDVAFENGPCSKDLQIPERKMYRSIIK